MICAAPDAGRGPAQPSPAAPRVALQVLPSAEAQLNENGIPALADFVDAVNVGCGGPVKVTIAWAVARVDAPPLPHWTMYV